MNPFSSIVDYVKSIISIGVGPNDEPHDRIIVQVINLIFVLGVVSVFIDGTSRAFAGYSDIRDYYSIVIFFGVCALGLYLNYRNKYDFATAIATIGFASLFFFNVQYYELTDSKAELIFLSLAVTAPLAFRKRWVGIAAFIYIATLLGLILWTMNDYANFSLIFNVMLIATGMVITTGGLIRHLRRSAEELKIKNKKLQVQNYEQEELIVQIKLKTEMLGILAHDLKGPAASFNLLSKKVSLLLRKERYEELEELEAYFELAGDKIYHDIDRLLNWTIAQKENIIIRAIECSPFQLVENITESLSLQFKDKTVSFVNEISKDLIITTDSHILEIIIKNLLNNASQQVNDGESVRIAYSELNHSGSIFIHNPGASISREVVEQAKAGKYRKSKNGHGLGLGICFSLIPFLKGNISFDTTTNPGTTAVVSLPLK